MRNIIFSMTSDKKLQDIWQIVWRVYCQCYTQRNIFEILLNQTEIRLYIPFSDWFEAKRTSVWFQINRKMLNKIWFLFDLIRFRKKIVCVVWRIYLYIYRIYIYIYRIYISICGTCLKKEKKIIYIKWFVGEFFKICMDN